MMHDAKNFKHDAQHYQSQQQKDRLNLLQNN